MPKIHLPILFALFILTGCLGSNPEKLDGTWVYNQKLTMTECLDEPNMAVKLDEVYITFDTSKRIMTVHWDDDTPAASYTLDPQASRITKLSYRLDNWHKSTITIEYINDNTILIVDNTEDNLHRAVFVRYHKPENASKDSAPDAPASAA